MRLTRRSVASVDAAAVAASGVDVALKGLEDSVPLPNITDTYRITINWSTVEGVTPRNVFHVRKASSNVADVLSGIDEAIDDMASPSHLFHCCRDDQVATTIDILKLDNNSGTVTATLATPLTGGSGTGQMTPALCGLVSLRTGLRGPARRGRVYCGPAAEAHAGNGTLDGTTRPLMQAAWDDFAESLDTDWGGNLVVASYTNSDARDVNQVTVESVCATQRRRQSQLRI